MRVAGLLQGSGAWSSHRGPTKPTSDHQASLAFLATALLATAFLAAGFAAGAAALPATAFSALRRAAFGSTAALKAEPGVNFGSLLAAILSLAPVDGFTPYVLREPPA